MRGGRTHIHPGNQFKTKTKPKTLSTVSHRGFVLQITEGKKKREGLRWPQMFMEKGDN